MLIGAAFAVIASLAFMFSTTPLLLSLSVLIYGASVSLSGISTLAFVTEASARDHHARVQGYNGATQGLSALVGALFVGLLLQVTSPRVTFGVVAILSLLNLLAVKRLDYPARRRGARFGLTEAATSYMRAAALIRTRRHIQLAGLVTFNYNFVFLVVGNSFLPLFIIKNLALSAVFAGIVLALRNGVATLVSSSFGFIVVRVGFRRAMVVSNGVAAFAVLLTATAQGRLSLLFLGALQGIGCGIGAATTNMLVTSATSINDRALGFASSSSVSKLGTLLLSLMLGVVLELWGMRATFIVAGLASGLCVSLITLLSSSGTTNIEAVV
jgi:MFS family permease